MLTISNDVLRILVLIAILLGGLFLIVGIPVILGIVFHQIVVFFISLFVISMISFVLIPFILDR